MTTTTAARRARTTGRRHIPFRIVAVLIALAFLVVFGVWQSILTPWVTFPDATDHGWTRTPELHRYTDSASAAAMAAVGLGALVLALRPVGRSALVAWVAAMLTVVGMSSGVSVILQQHQGVGGALVQAVATVALTAVPFVLLHPERRLVLRGGASGAAGPTGVARAGLVAIALAGIVLTLGAVARRLTGVVAESPLEDDVLGYVVLGLALILGSSICLTGRAGWRTLAAILGAVSLYGIVGGLSLAFG
ncbi:hypothetical protein [Georgenia subflava]|uniref:DUF998 domain-containing protein n=1 Tax=Georgenia subflava TaxID=1622177 RepID=A0A6N7EKP2_9MICO|nr:hypothetical protein [Georgenia subflava]MPV37991.1 hypothetical protein [Georgenia subflava]